MRLTGYSDRWSAEPGQTLTFFVSSEQPRYRAQLVRLIHGDENPRGPGPKEEPLDSPINGEYRGVEQPIYTGSYVIVEDAAALASGFLTFQAWIRPSQPDWSEQAVAGQWDAEAQSGFLLLVDQGELELRVGTASGSPLVVRLVAPLSPIEWCFVAFTVDVAARKIMLRADCSVFHPARPSTVSVEAVGESAIVLAPGAPITIGAGWIDQIDGRTAPRACFNGKIEGPKAFTAALDASELDALSRGEVLGEAAMQSCAACWDFAFKPAMREIPDGREGRLDGKTVNRPMRATSSHAWHPAIERFTDNLPAYNAIWFHGDDLADAGWHPSLHLPIPDDLKSGIYAVKIEGEKGARDYLPFVVRPKRGTATARLAVLLPTISYMAYANEALLDLQELVGLTAHANRWLHQEEYGYLNRHHLRSLYDHHRDGSGICYSSILRPILTSFRPYHRCRSFDAPHQFSADLHLIDWLERKQIDYDVITDHDLHREGAELLGRYRAVMSGTHAEYWTEQMLDGLAAYEADGGRFICVSGNGLYWVTALDPEDQTVCEIRRANGSRTWAPEPGENHLSFTGEMGGLWRFRGRPPQRLIGVGTAGVGFDRGAPLRRSAASRDPAVAFIFEGVDEDVIGDFPALALGHGAAGFEIDRADHGLGTPAHAYLLASSFGHSDSYQPAMEEAFAIVPDQGGTRNPNIRTDMVFYELPNDGAVFTVGSVTFASSLSFNNYDNNCSRILENVTRSFLKNGNILQSADHSTE